MALGWEGGRPAREALAWPVFVVDEPGVVH
jgi:hypothetical protein